MQSIPSLNLHTLCLVKGTFCENTSYDSDQFPLCDLPSWTDAGLMSWIFRKKLQLKRKGKRKLTHPIPELIKNEYLFEISSNSSQQQLSVGTNARLLVPEDRTWAGSGPTTAVRFGSALWGVLGWESAPFSRPHSSCGSEPSELNWTDYSDSPCGLMVKGGRLNQECVPTACSCDVGHVFIRSFLSL